LHNLYICEFSVVSFSICIIFIVVQENLECESGETTSIIVTSLLEIKINTNISNNITISKQNE